MRRLTIFDFQLRISHWGRMEPRLTSLYASSIQNPKSKIQNSPSAAFSLVEVTLAIGIVSFALLAVVGLLPVGLRSVKNANEQAAAANVMNAIGDALRTASSTDLATFTNSFAGQTISYITNGSATSVTWTNLTLDGSVETAASPKRLSAVLIITPPTSLSVLGRATVSVAWSAQANPTWNTANQTWTKSEGSLTSGIQFLPKP